MKHEVTHVLTSPMMNETKRLAQRLTSMWIASLLLTISLFTYMNRGITAYQKREVIEARICQFTHVEFCFAFPRLFGFASVHACPLGVPIVANVGFLRGR